MIDRTHRLSVTRQARLVGLSRTGLGTYDAEHDWASALYGSATVAVLDDAVGSGGTLRRVAAMAASVGCTISKFVTCASLRSSRDQLRVQLRQTRWSEYLAGDWRAVHLRDGCPYLPFTGRRTGERVLGSSVQVQVPTRTLDGSLWQVLHLDPSVRSAVNAAGLLVANRLSSHLGRPARIGDLAILGSSVAAIAEDQGALTSESVLAGDALR